MVKNKLIRKKIHDKTNNKAIMNPYTYKFLTELCLGYSFTLGVKNDIDKFFKVKLNCKEIKNIILNRKSYDFSTNFEELIEEIIKSVIVHGEAYFKIISNYEVSENDYEDEKINISLYELEGIRKGANIYYENELGHVCKVSVNDKNVVVIKLEELGYDKNYFKKLFKLFEKNDIAQSVNLLFKEPSYNYVIHQKKINNLFSKYVREIGWMFNLEELSDSYILFNQIKIRKLKLRLLQYVLRRINLVLEKQNKGVHSCEIVATYRDVDYDEIWMWFQSGDLNTVQLADIIYQNNESEII